MYRSYRNNIKLGFGSAGGDCPEGTVCIGTGTSTNNNIPANNFYNYSLTQQIYTADELGDAGAIQSIAFYKNSTNYMARDLDIYMVNTTKTHFNSESDWIPATAADLVYSGTVTFADDAWTTITLNTPFPYNGTSNVAIIVDDNTGEWESSTPFYVFSTGTLNQAIYYYNDDDNLDPTTALTADGDDIIASKNRLRIVKGNVTCFPVTNLVASDITPHSVTLSWIDNNNTGATYSIYDIHGNTEVAAGINGTSYTITGLNAETSYTFGVVADCSSTDASSMATITVTTDVACPAPTGVHADNISGFTADVSWNGSATSYIIEYASCTPSANWLQYDNDTLSDHVGSSSSNVWTWGVMYPASTVSGNWLTKIAYYEVSNRFYIDNTITVKVYSGGSDAPGTLVGTYTIATEGSEAIREIAINPIEIDPTQNLWITLTSNATYCMALCDQDGGANSRWVYLDNEWIDLGTAYSPASNSSFMIRAFTETINGSWTAVSGVNSPYSLSNLEPLTDYIVRVKSDCGSEGVSAWSSAFFTTDSPCPVPSLLTATNVSGNGATLGWRGFNESYNIRYRKAEATTGFYDGFENGLGQWTIYTAGETVEDYNDGWFTYNPLEDLDHYPHSGDSCASAWSWRDGDAINANNWLVSPQVPLGGVLKFWVFTSADYPDRYEVLLSTTGNDTSSFTITLQEMAQAPDNEQWNEVTIDLSSYTGNGHIAIHHVDEDMNYLFIDDFSVTVVTNPAGDWATLSSNTNSISVYGLDTSTVYEFQVQGICNGETTEWSSLCQFTTTNETPQSAILTVSVDGSMGSVLINGNSVPSNTYNGIMGETVTLTAVANDNCVFLGWVNATGDTISRENVHQIVLVQPTTTITAAFFRHENHDGIEDNATSDVCIFARANGIVVRGAAHQQVYIYDVVGRMVGHISSANDEEFIHVPQLGVYLVKVGDRPAQRIVSRQ